MKNPRFPYFTFALVLLSAALLAQCGEPVPTTPTAMQDVANSIVALVNNQDADGLAAMTAEGASYLDEDGHALPATVWIGKLTGNPKQMEISAIHGEILDNAAWVSFNYTLRETSRGEEIMLMGTADLLLEQLDGHWMIHMVHGALEQHVSAFVGAE